ncbi:MAG: GTP-binding signal recognition particle G-domain FlhF [Pseudomonadota bacterium]|jgi:flagellar biosynthesis protein FlhF
MNLKRFTGRTSREALALVRQAFGQDAVVMSTRPCPEGVEVLAMAPESLQHLEKVGAAAPLVDTPLRLRQPAAALPAEGTVEQDVEQLAMSTLSFQDYVRERMLKRRRSELAAQADEAVAGATGDATRGLPLAAPGSMPPAPRVAVKEQPARAAATQRLAAAADEPVAPRTTHRSTGDSVFLRDLHDPRDAADDRPVDRPSRAAPARAQRAEREVGREHAELQREQHEMLRELRSVRGLIEQRFGALAFMEKMQRQPRHALLSHKLLECGFSPALVRKLVDSLPPDGDETDWASGVLQRNLLTGEGDAPLEDLGGVYALIGPTGVGKTTSTAKLAAAFAARHGAANLGLITLDAYRVAAHEQLRAYGRILGVPVHTAHDRASLDDLLELLSAKRMVLIDTAGMAQRDTRTKELLDMLSHRSVNRLLVVNAASQGETVEDVLSAYRAGTCRGVVLSKIDEAMKLGPALDALIRHKVKVLAVANGQRVPEDWHHLSAQALIQRALRAGGSSAWKLDNADVNLVFTAQPPTGAAVAPAPMSGL